MVFVWIGRFAAAVVVLVLAWLMVCVALGQYGRAIVLLFALYGAGSATASAFSLVPVSRAEK